MQYLQFIITDNPGFESGISEFRKKIQADIYSLDRLRDVCSANPDQIVQIIFYITAASLESRHQEIHETLKHHPSVISRFIVVAPLDYDPIGKTKIEKDLFYSTVPEGVPSFFLATTLINAFGYLQMIQEKFELQKKVNISSNEISKLTTIGISLSIEKDYTKLLRLILDSAREIALADSGSLYLVDKDETGKPVKLRFKISALHDIEEFSLDINKESIAGYVASTGEQLNIPDTYALTGKEEYKFNKKPDKDYNYYSKSMLVVPMKNHKDEVVGVIQLINKKKNFNQKLTVEQMKGGHVFPFDSHSEELVMSVSGQAAVAIQNNNLVQEIETLFEGFVTASVSAIEARDRTTSGHSFRVADYTVGLAEVVDRLDSEKYKNVNFTKTQMKEIRYASLLHDFGKVGVREKVLVKEKKLESYELDLIKWRFFYIKKDIESKLHSKKLEYLKKRGNFGFDDYESALDVEYRSEIRKLDEMLAVIVHSNEPSVLEQASSERLVDISRVRFSFLDGAELDVLTPAEFNFLSIKKGTLNKEEREEIESHVTHTFHFLNKIPWTSDLKMIPSIAYAHHEKLDGSGYPRRISGIEIPIQSRMMTIADIYDALTAQDRPYKKAVPVDRALDILKMEVKDGHVDQDLLNIFIEAKVFEAGHKIAPNQSQ